MTSLNPIYGHPEKTLQLGSSNLNCYILENKLRVISISSIQKALGYEGPFSNWLLEILTEIHTYFPIPNDILACFENPIHIIFKGFSNQNIGIRVIDATLFTATCQIIQNAKKEGLLNKKQNKIAKKAALILQYLDNTTIEHLIDEATGFNIYKVKVLEKYTTLIKNQKEEAAIIWIKTIPYSFIEDLLAMNSLAWDDIEYLSEKFGSIFNEIIFSRINETLLEDLRTSKPKRSYQRKPGLIQELEHPELKKIITVLQSIVKVSGYQWAIYIQLLNKIFPKLNNSNLSFEDNEVLKKIIPLSDFNTSLKKILTFSEKNIT